MKRRGNGDKTAPGETPDTPSTRTVRRPARLSGGEEEDVILAPPLVGVIGYLLRRSHNAFQAYWMANFRDSDTPITPVQGGMLVVLAANPGLTQTALARMMKVEGPTLMQSIDRLEQHGYLQRLRRIGDRRSYSLQLTPRGREVLAAINAFLPLRDQEMLADLTPEEIDQLTILLTKIVERGHQRLRELQNAAGDQDSGPAKARRTSRAG
jgi:DNA-binding MarR family transcriptional regulator